MFWLILFALQHTLLLQKKKTRGFSQFTPINVITHYVPKDKNFLDKQATTQLNTTIGATTNMTFNSNVVKTSQKAIKTTYIAVNILYDYSQQA